jgi:hypothetical protein
MTCTSRPASQESRSVYFMTLITVCWTLMKQRSSHCSHPLATTRFRRCWEGFRQRISQPLMGSRHHSVGNGTIGKVGAIGSMLSTGSAFEVGVGIGSAVDATWFHPCTKH